MDILTTKTDTIESKQLVIDKDDILWLVRNYLKDNHPEIQIKDYTVYMNLSNVFNSDNKIRLTVEYPLTIEVI